MGYNTGSVSNSNGLNHSQSHTSNSKLYFVSYHGELLIVYSDTTVTHYYYSLFSNILLAM